MGFKYDYRKGKAFILSYTYKNPQGDVVPVGNTEQPLKFKTCLENNAGFEVENVKYDLTAQETRSFIYEAGKMDYGDYDCVLITIISYGFLGGFTCSDWEDIDERELVTTFMHSPSLYGKPKIFVFDYCRGPFVDPVPNKMSGDKDHIASSRPPMLFLPETEDILKIHASYEGYTAYNSIEGGAPFLSFLQEELESSKEDLVSMLTRTNYKFSELLVGGNLIDLRYDNKSQAAIFTCSLRKKLFFNDEK